MKKVILSPFLLLLLSGCNNPIQVNTPDLFADTTTYFYVYESPNKEIKLNGNYISKTELETRFSKLAIKGGIVNYSCVGATENPPAKSEVIDLIIKYKLPIKMFVDSTFTQSFY